MPNLNLAAEAITERTKAMILVSANGRYPREGIDAFRTCGQKGLLLIEDAAQALGSYYPDGTHVGRVAAETCYLRKSFYRQGGALIADDDAIANRLRKLKFRSVRGGQRYS